MHLARATLMMCQFLVPVIEAQKKKGHYVCVCGSDDPDAQRLMAGGIDVFCHHLQRSLNPFAIIREILRIKRILIEQRIDVIICHTPLGGGVGRIAARLAKTPTVIYFAHGVTCAPGQNRLKWLFWYGIEKMLGKLTDAILVMNSYDERLCKDHHFIKDTNKVFRVPGMGVNLDKFQFDSDIAARDQIEKELHIPEGKKILISVAYLIPQKGVFVFLDAAREICARRDDMYFLLAGEGPFLEKLQAQSREYELEKYFKLLGWRDDIHKLMRAADIFVLPTWYFEGLPVSILEAMACGKPVIATRHRGCEDAVLDDRTGFLVPVKQVGPLVEKMELLADDRSLRDNFGRHGRERIEKEFEIKYCTDKILTAIEKATVFSDKDKA